MSNSFIWPINRVLSSATTPDFYQDKNVNILEKKKKIVTLILCSNFKPIILKHE